MEGRRFMTLITNLDDRNIVNVILEEAKLESFIFDTNFRLKFECKVEKEFEGKKLPREVTLSILSDWWFGNKENWDYTVKKMTEGCNFVEPEEPVLAFKLAALRWSDGSDIVSVNISAQEIDLMFRCGETVTILNNYKHEIAWEIFETNFNNVNDCWSVVCDEGRIYYNIPT